VFGQHTAATENHSRFYRIWMSPAGISVLPAPAKSNPRPRDLNDSQGSSRRPVNRIGKNEPAAALAGHIPHRLA
jgi:hypothetical protein